MSQIIDVGEGYMGIHRLSIMVLHPEEVQPFFLDGDYAICNGELYSFLQIKIELITMGYRFKSGSDCEIILPMYRQFGLSMFAMLDAEFAMVI